MIEIFNGVGIALGFISEYGVPWAILVVVSWGGWKLFSNHLAHIGKDIKAIKGKTNCMDKKINKIVKDIAVQKAVCNERHGKK